jgi:tetratricopeptide (TPR) repeat protein
MPNDKDALALRQQIDQAKKDAAGAAAAMDAKKQEYAKQMTAARAALGARRYDEALQAVAAALAAMPNDRDALALRAQVDKAKADAAAMKADADKKREFGRLMLQARSAMAAKKYDDAIKAYTAALVLYPSDTEATRGLADAKKASETRPAPMPMPPAKPPLYAKQMDAGLAQEKAGKYDLALNAYKAALRLVPGDADADRKVDFCQAMLDGAKAMQQRKFPDAVKAYESALKLFPNDQAAKQALARAKAGK